jgi:hypothetical membrane protein
MKGKPMAHTSEPISTADRSDPSLSSLGKGLQSPLTFGLVSSGGIGALLFTAVYLIEGFTRPGYDAWQQAIAALSLGPGGRVQQVNFIVYGVLLVLSSVGWYRFLTPGRGAIWFPVFQGISGLCLIGIGVVSVLTPLHTILAWVLILTLAAGCFAFAQYALNAQGRGWFVYSLITGLLILIFWGSFWSGTFVGLVPLAGLAERVSAGSHALWICVLVATLFFSRRRQRMSSSTPK